MNECQTTGASCIALLCVLLCGCETSTDAGVGDSAAEQAARAEVAADELLAASTLAEQQEATATLTELGPAAEQATARVLDESTNEYVKIRMIESLAEMGGYEGVPQILETLDDESATVRMRADEALQDLLCIRVRYDANAPPEERAAAVQRYHDYWNRLVENNMVQFVKHPEKAQDVFKQRVMHVGGKRQEPN